MTVCDIIVIGGGPAGMMAAGKAAERGAAVALIEKNQRNGKKLLITGKGRCNVTNNCSRDEFFANIPVNPKFLYSAFSQFSNRDVMDFFETNGVPLKVERETEFFPYLTGLTISTTRLSDIVKKAAFMSYVIRQLICQLTTGAFQA